MNFEARNITREKSDATIAPAIGRYLGTLEGSRVIAIVPVIVAFYAQSPERYEVIEAVVFTERI